VVEVTALLNRVSQVRILPRFNRTQLTELDTFLLVQNVCVVVESPLGLEPPPLVRMRLASPSQVSANDDD
jgi:hypothetical protein